MQYIKLKHRSIAMPENWNELTLPQLFTLAVYGMRKLTVQHLKVSMLLATMKARVMRKVGDGVYRLSFGPLRRSVTLTLAEGQAMAENFSFLVAKRGDTHHIDSHLTRDHFPKLRIGGHRFYGPGDVLEHLTYEQFMWCQTYLQRMQAELQTREFTATVGGGVVKATAYGSKALKSIEIDPSCVDPDDVEMLQDLVLSAVNEALRTADESVNSEMSRLTGGMNLGGLF